jgi:hypothetical protein
MTMQLGIYREATWAFVKVKSDVSQAVYKIITLATLASRGFDTRRDMRYETILPRNRNGGMCIATWREWCINDALKLIKQWWVYNW